MTISWSLLHKSPSTFVITEKIRSHQFSHRSHPLKKEVPYRVCLRLWRLTNNQHSTTTPPQLRIRGDVVQRWIWRKPKDKEIRRFHYLNVVPRTNLCWNLTCEVFDLLHSPRPHTLCPILVESQTNFSCWWVLISNTQCMIYIFLYIWIISMVDAGKYTIHWVSGYVFV